MGGRSIPIDCPHGGVLDWGDFGNPDDPTDGVCTVCNTPQAESSGDWRERCRRCDGPNTIWSAPSPLWNAVMRDGSINGVEPFNGIICPACFAQLAEEAGIATGWRFYADDVAAELETVTPSGRVWNPDTWMWDEPATAEGGT